MNNSMKLIKLKCLQVLPAFALLLINFAFAALPAAAEKKLAVTSSVMKEGAVIDKKYSGDGADLSPPIAWTQGPASTKSYALCCFDPDAPVGTWWHWIIFNIDPKTTQLGENVPKAAKLAAGVSQGANDFGRPGYNGPSPPPGSPHHYHFKVMALDCMLKLKPNCKKEEFNSAVKGHVLAEGELTGLYKR